MVDQKIKMDVDETLEFDYLVEEVSRDAVTIDKEPSGLSESYYSTDTYVFDPSGTGTFQLDINGQTIEIQVTDIPDSAVSWFKFDDDGDTSTATDSEGSNPGTITGAAYTTTSKQGTNALDFDGTDDYVEANNFSEIDASKSWSVICWFKADQSNTGQQALWGQAPGTNNRQILFLENDRLTANVYDGVHNKTGTAFSDKSSFHQVAVAYNGSGSPTLYLDASSVSGSTEQRTPGTDSNFYIGDKNANAASFDGIIDSVEIYSEELSSSQIQDRYDEYA